jgi:SPP1 family predicted phage head-tail adaptor
MIQKATEARDTSGGVTKSWATFAQVWAAIDPISGREFLLAKQTNATMSHKVVIRYLDGVVPTMRVSFGGRILNIDSVINTTELNREMVLVCTEVL